MLKRMIWKLASPYDAYVSHVAKLESSFARIRNLNARTAGYEMGLRSSVRLVQGDADASERADRFRKTLSDAAESMTDSELEGFLAELGGGETADVESDRADIAERMEHATSGLREAFTTAAAVLKLLEERGYDPERRDIARQLAANQIKPRPLAEYQAELHELAVLTGHTAESGSSN